MQFAPVPAAHRVERVLDDVHEYLLDLDAIRHHHAVRIMLDAAENVLAGRIDQREAAGLVDQRIEGFGPHFNSAARDEFADTADNVAGPHRALVSVVQRLCERIPALPLDRGQQPFAAADIMGDRGERLVEIVRDCGGHRSHRAQSGEARQFRLRAMKRLQRGAALLDILQRAIPGDLAVMAVHALGSTRMDPAIGAILHAHSPLGLEFLKRLGRVRPFAADPRDIVGVGEGVPAVAKRLGDVRARPGCPAPAGRKDLSCLVSRPWDQAAQFDDVAIQLFAAAQLLLRLLKLHRVRVALSRSRPIHCGLRPATHQAACRSSAPVLEAAA